MRRATLLGFLCASAALAHAATARSINEAVSHLSLDQTHTYRVRDLHLIRGGVKIYLNEGILAFALPIEGKTVAAVFTTQGVEGGDGEVLALPASRSERASLASYTKAPNLNDHFGSAVFYFSDATMQECLAQLGESPSPVAGDVAEQLKPSVDRILSNIHSDIDLDLVESVLDGHRQEDGFLYAAFAGRDLGIFNFFYDPRMTEPVTIGQMKANSQGATRFDLWTSFRPANLAQVQRGAGRPQISNYEIHAAIADNLRFTAEADFNFSCDRNICDGTHGRVLRFDLSDRLHVTDASIDRDPAELFARSRVPGTQEPLGTGTFLLVTENPLTPGLHRVSVHYGGDIVSRTPSGSFVVEDRNTWYPYAGSMLTSFDMTFRCPANLQVVSTGDLTGDAVVGNVRTVHRQTTVPEHMAGFNLGDYTLSTAASSRYRIDIFANRSTAGSVENLGGQMASILDHYSQRWSNLPFRSVAVSPVPGHFGQGFPGLIYLSDVTYLQPKSRPANLRTPRMTSFFSGMLLPHEVAHQWWGNLVVPADYRSAWLAEAFASYSALQYLAQHEGPESADALLEQYRKDLLIEREGRTLESSGPVDFGVRLQDTAGKDAWQTITYEKGSWVLHMLQERLGKDRWRQVELQLLRDFSDRPITNDEFRKTVAASLPPGGPDPELRAFFDTWVYSTGLPELTLRKESNGWELEVSRVDDDFIADVPLECHSKLAGRSEVRWVRATAGTNFIQGAGATRACSLPPLNRFLYRSPERGSGD